MRQKALYWLLKIGYKRLETGDENGKTSEPMR
jgi:hypothetical protein